MSRLQGKVALVTGASKGIGAAIALELASQGAAVAVNYSGSKAGADKVVAEIKQAGGRAIAVQANVADPDTIGPLIETVSKQLGPISILVNNAGIYEFGPLEAVTPEHFHKQFNVNVLGLLLTTQAAAQALRARRRLRNQHRICCGSRNSFGFGLQRHQGRPRLHHRCAWQANLGPKKIRVNSLNPGMIETEGTHTAGFIGSDFQKKTESETPLGRIGQPQDIASIAAFLASDDSYWVNGQTIQASGGARI